MEQGKIGIVNGVRLFPSRQNWLDERVFEEIFDEHYPRIYAVVFRLVGDRDEADDLCAETFWRLWESPPAKNENLAGWLYRVATRLGYNALRSAKRRMVYETQAGRDALEHEPTLDPASEIETLHERQRVHKVLRQLSMRDVQILILRHSGLSYKEIAAAANVTAGSIGKLLARAEEKFAKLYSKGDQDAPKR